MLAFFYQEVHMGKSYMQSHKQPKTFNYTGPYPAPQPNCSSRVWLVQQLDSKYQLVQQVYDHIGCIMPVQQVCTFKISWPFMLLHGLKKVTTSRHWAVHAFTWSQCKYGLNLISSEVLLYFWDFHEIFMNFMMDMGRLDF